MKNGVVNSIKDLNNYCEKTGKSIVLTKDGRIKGFKGKGYSYNDYMKYKRAKRKKKDLYSPLKKQMRLKT